MKRDNRKHAGKPTLAELQTKLDGVRREVRNLTVMGMDPKQPPDQAALIKELEQSARAEMRLRSMALAHAKANCVLMVRNARALARLTNCARMSLWELPWASSPQALPLVLRLSVKYW